jgi:uncharacterized protein with NRDE domain
MCLVLLAWRVHPRYPLIVAANRDEFLVRPTQAAHRWPGTTGLIAGKDLEAGGTWMGVDALGRFAAVTNFRELEKGPADARSRGELVSDYLQGSLPARDYLGELAMRAQQYRGYNLLASDATGLYCASNRGAGSEIVALEAGIHGVCNGPLDSDWPKVLRGKQLLGESIQRDEPDEYELLTLLSDAARPADSTLPETGVGLEWERVLGSIFIDTEHYATRSQTLLLQSTQGETRMIERSRAESGAWRDQQFVL